MQLIQLFGLLTLATGAWATPSPRRHNSQGSTIVLHINGDGDRYEQSPIPVVDIKRRNWGEYEVIQSGLLEDVTKIDWGKGPIQINGHVDPHELTLQTEIGVAKVGFGPITGNLRDGVSVRLNLENADGQIRLYLKNGNEVWTHLDVHTREDGPIQGDYKVVSI